MNAAEKVLERARTDPAVLALPLAMRAVWILLADLLGRSGGTLDPRFPPSAVAMSIGVTEGDLATSLETMVDLGLVERGPDGNIVKPFTTQNRRSEINRRNALIGVQKRRARDVTLLGKV